MARPCNRHTSATVTAVLHVYGFSFSLFGRAGLRGKKTRNSSSLSFISNSLRNEVIEHAHITLKQNHCTPTCAIPNKPATHSNVLTVLQHATSARDAGSTKIFAKAHVPEVVPRRMKYGEIPSDVPRVIIL